MQAIPILHECETASFLAQGNQVWVVGANHSKRWATAQLPADLAVGPDAFELPENFPWMTTEGLDSGVLEEHDLGAPLIVQGPDGTARIAAIAVGVDPASYVGTHVLAEWTSGTSKESLRCDHRPPLGAM